MLSLLPRLRAPKPLLTLLDQGAILDAAQRSHSCIAQKIISL